MCVCVYTRGGVDVCCVYNVCERDGDGGEGRRRGKGIRKER